MLETGRLNAWASLFLCAVIFSLYSVSLGHDFLFDEVNIIIRNPAIKRVEMFPEIFRHGFFQLRSGQDEAWQAYYRPLTTLSFAVDFRFWKGNPLGYNLTNVFLHGAVCLLFFRLTLLLLGDSLAAFSSAFIYAVHTVPVEAVTYLASRSDLLAALILTASMLLFLRSRFGTALALYVLSLFAKESAVLLPFYLTFLEWAFGEKNGKRSYLKLAPFFAMALLPVCQIVHFYPEWAEHYLYVPAMGIAILAGCLMKSLFKHKR